MRPRTAIIIITIPSTIQGRKINTRQQKRSIMSSLLFDGSRSVLQQIHENFYLLFGQGNIKQHSEIPELRTFPDTLSEYVRIIYRFRAAVINIEWIDRVRILNQMAVALNREVRSTVVYSIIGSQIDSLLR
jgi:hypothetical protein